MDYYYYLSLSGSYKVDDIDDKREFQETLVRAGSGPRRRGSAALAGPGVGRAGTAKSEEQPLEDHRMSCKGGRSEFPSPPPPRRCSNR